MEASWRRNPVHNSSPFESMMNSSEFIFTMSQLGEVAPSLCLIRVGNLAKDRTTSYSVTYFCFWHTCYSSSYSETINDYFINVVIMKIALYTSNSRRINLQCSILNGYFLSMTCLILRDGIDTLTY